MVKKETHTASEEDRAAQAFVVSAYAAGGSSAMPYIGDHTYAITVKESHSVPEIYYDCGGGHSGDDVKKIYITTGNAKDLVRMTIGVTNPQPPYKTEYGENDVTGRETCGVKMSGFRNRDGTCQQAVNRLLYAISPNKNKPLTLAGGQYVPRGYWLTVGYFGKWGTGFDKWCSQSGFPKPPSEREALEQSLHFLDTKKRTYVIDQITSLKEKDFLPEQHRQIETDLYREIESKLDMEDLTKMGIRPTKEQSK